VAELELLAYVWKLMFLIFRNKHFIFHLFKVYKTEICRQHQWVDRVYPVWSCETVAKSRDMEENCIWPNGC